MSASVERPKHHRRPKRRWAVLAVAVVVVCAALGGYLAAAPSGSRVPEKGASAAGRRPAASAPRTTVHPSTATTTITAPPPATTIAAPPPATTTTGPGTLPQTSTLPPASSPPFADAMAALWQGVVTGSVTPAMPAFFPEAAYRRLKALPTPTADFEERLVHDYALDLRAAHGLPGVTLPTASLVTVSVPEGDAHWISPGVCANSIGYYEVPNARVVYLAAGVTRSFGIASMISWRGEWYVVHLGAVLRPTTTTGGQLDAPATGPGYSAPSSTC